MLFKIDCRFSQSDRPSGKCLEICTEQMSDEVKHWAVGFQMILNQFKDVLSNNGVVAFRFGRKAFRSPPAMKLSKWSKQQSSSWNRC